MSNLASRFSRVSRVSQAISKILAGARPRQKLTCYFHFRACFRQKKWEWNPNAFASFIHSQTICLACKLYDVLPAAEYHLLEKQINKKKQKSLHPTASHIGKIQLDPLDSILALPVL